MTTGRRSRPATRGPACWRCSEMLAKPVTHPAMLCRRERVRGGGEGGGQESARTRTHTHTHQPTPHPTPQAVMKPSTPNLIHDAHSLTVISPASGLCANSHVFLWPWQMSQMAVRGACSALNNRHSVHSILDLSPARTPSRSPFSSPQLAAASPPRDAPLMKDKEAGQSRHTLSSSLSLFVTLSLRHTLFVTLSLLHTHTLLLSLFPQALASTTLHTHTSIPSSPTPPPLCHVHIHVPTNTPHAGSAQRVQWERRALLCLSSDKHHRRKIRHRLRWRPFVRDRPALLEQPGK